jgi:hypothetical protein
VHVSAIFDEGLGKAQHLALVVAVEPVERNVPLGDAILVRQVTVAGLQELVQLEDVIANLNGVVKPNDDGCGGGGGGGDSGGSIGTDPGDPSGSMDPVCEDGCYKAYIAGSRSCNTIANKVRAEMCWEYWATILADCLLEC